MLRRAAARVGLLARLQAAAQLSRGSAICVDIAGTPLVAGFLDDSAIPRSAVSHGNGFSTAPAESSGDSSGSSSSGSSNGTGGSSRGSTGSRSSSGGYDPAAQRLLALSQSHDTRQPGDPHFSKQLTPEKRLRVTAMLLQHGVTEATVASMIARFKGGPYVSSVSGGAAVLEELRARGCDNERLNGLLQRAPTIMARPASNVMASFAALDDILQLSRSDVLRVCEEQPSLLSRDAGSLRRNWAKVQERYQLPPKVVRSLQKMMRYSRATTALLTYDSDTVKRRLSGLQQLFGLSDGDVVALFRCLVQLLELQPEEGVRPRRDKLEALLGPFDKQTLRRFLQSRFVFPVPVATIEAVFERAAELMGGVEAAQQLLLAEPKLFAAGVQRLRLNLAALQRPEAGCTLEEARQVLLSTPPLAVNALDTPKFQRRMEALTDFYEHASTAEMLLSRNRGTQLKSSLWTVGPRMAFVRHLRLERGQPHLRTSQVACTLGPFCRSVRADVATYKGFEAAWLASPEAAQLCEHERPRRQAAGGSSGSGGSDGGSDSSDDSSSGSSSEEEGEDERE